MIRSSFIAAVLLAAPPASAHGAFAGAGGFYAGALHPLVAFEHLLLLIGLGLSLGRATSPAHPALAALGLGLAAGLALGAAGTTWAAAPEAVLIAGLATGAGLAGALLPPRWLLRSAAAAVGLLVGLDTDAPLPSGPSALETAWIAYGGVFVGVFLIVLNAMAIASVADRPPFSIGLRVAGSWIAAATLLVLALEVRRLGGGA